MKRIFAGKSNGMRTRIRVGMSIVMGVGLSMGISGCSTGADAGVWPDGGNEAKPAARWWWMGSAVDSANLKSLIEEYAESGLGGLEICPIYGVQGNEAAEIPFLSERWMNMYAYARDLAEAKGMRLDVTCGTGWPFGGPNVTLDRAAARLEYAETDIVAKEGGESVEWNVELIDARRRRGASLIDVYAFGEDGKREKVTEYVKDGILKWDAPEGKWHLYALWHGHTFQMVKRAAPGGEGFVMDYFSKEAVSHYLGRFDTAFAQVKMPFPKMMFSDSYEVYGADYTAGIFDEFEKMHGYRVEDYLPWLLDKVEDDTSRRVRADYCETVDSLLRNCFLQNWVDWLHSKGSTAREQAHGSVGNLLDLYALSDVPECETYGRAKVQIRELMVPDTFQRKNESDKTIMKFASSGAHVMGKKLTSAESLTWASEHFRMTPAICKPELDALFLAGINKIFFHGTAYSPKEAAWPGWKFYASVDYSPTNVFWPELKELNGYVERVQSFMQAGKADADVLVYFPMYDVWYNQNTRYLNLSIENLQVVAADFLKFISEVENDGYQTDYISDRQIMGLRVKNGKLVTSAGVEYETVVVPGVRFMHAEVLAHLEELAQEGATIVFTGRYPTEAPGMARSGEKEKMENLVSALPESAFGEVESKSMGKGMVVTTGGKLDLGKIESLTLTEESMTEDGLRYVRRRNADGFTYFIANLDLEDVDAEVKLGVKWEDVVLYDALRGEIGRPSVEDGKVRVQLESGETVILRTYDAQKESVEAWNYRIGGDVKVIALDKGWSVKKGDVEVKTDTLAWWTEVSDDMTGGECTYRATFTMDEKPSESVIRLHNVKETAEVAVNGVKVGKVWAHPYVMDIAEWTKAGENEITVTVRASAANRIAQMERDGVVWRKFKDTNILDVKGKRRDFAWWPVEAEGMKGPVVVEYK